MIKFIESETRIIESMRNICIGYEQHIKVMETYIESNCPAYVGKRKDLWINKSEVMIMLQINSSTTLQKHRDEGDFIFYQLSRKHIIYDYESVNDYVKSKKIS